MMKDGGGAGGPGGGAFGGGGGDRQRSTQEGPVTKTLYIIAADQPANQNPLKPVLEAKVVKLGISDGTNTEVIEGLKEGDVIVTGLATSDTAAGTSGQRPPSSPFGSPFGGGGPRR
jgi:HlyD family secretion protein